MRRQTVKKEMFKISFENTDVEIDMKTGKGEIISFIKTPIISQAMSLHKTLLISGFITLIFCPEFNYDCINGYHHDQVRKVQLQGTRLETSSGRNSISLLFLFLLA
jgi:hypothetical protein